MGMVKFTRAELAAFHGATVDDLIDDRVRLLFVGINPGLWTAAVNAHFARRAEQLSKSRRSVLVDEELHAVG